MEPNSHESLPTNVRPIHYDLFLRPDLDKETFFGRVAIDIRVDFLEEETDRIVLNAAELEMSRDNCWLITGDHHFGIVTQKPIRMEVDEKAEQVTFVFSEPIPSGRARLLIAFKGKLNDRMIGFYLSKYTAADGTEKRIATTQMEPHLARHAFPCFDQPDMKATFDIQVTAPIGMTVVSNTSLDEVLDGEENETHVFRRTPPMSTYLVAITVGELECITDVTDDGVELRLWTTPGKQEQGRFALEVTKKCLAYYGEYFGITYRQMGFDKLDQIAVPDFAFGAMENWGAIIYRETALLVDEKSSEVHRQNAAETVTHELAHQWFGNLVTMKWWNDLWLNESFATLMANKALDHIFPTWDVWPEFVCYNMASAMGLDQKKSTHPIIVGIPRAADVDEVFDRISYEKGGCVLRMLENHVGAEKFRDGVRSYLAAHICANAEGAELWQAINAAAPDKGVTALMESWLSEPGFPLATLLSENGNPDSCFINTVGFQDGQAAGKRWPMDPDAEVFDDEGIQATVLDPGRFVFARVRYDDALMGRIAKALRLGKIETSATRFALQDDAFALSYRHANAIPFLEIVEALARAGEREHAVWSSLLDNIYQLDYLLDDRSNMIDQWLLDLMSIAAAEIGWHAYGEEPPNRQMLRPMLLKAAIAYGNPLLLKQALRLFDMVRNNGLVVDPNLLQVLYYAVMKARGKEGREQLLAMYRTTDSHEEKRRLLTALGNCQDADDLSAYLDFVFSDEVRKQDRFIGIAACAKSQELSRLAWERVKREWPNIIEAYKGNNMMIGRYLYVAERLATRSDLKDVRAFLAENKVEGLGRTYEQTLEGIELNIGWRERNVSVIQDWLSERLAK